MNRPSGFGNLTTPQDLLAKLIHDRGRMQADPHDTYAAVGRRWVKFFSGSKSSYPHPHRGSKLLGGHPANCLPSMPDSCSKGGENPPGCCVAGRGLGLVVIHAGLQEEVR